MTNKQVMQDSPEVHIGSAPHPKRNLLIAAGLVIGGALIGLFYWESDKSSTIAIDELHQFRQEMAHRCNLEEFARPSPTQFNEVYADSSRMQKVVHEQYNSLKRDQTSCDQVLKAIKSVDYPVEAQ